MADVEGAFDVVAKLARLYSQDATDAEDIRQEILLQAWRAYPDFGGRSKFSTWLYSIGVHVCLGWTRTVERRTQREASHGESSLHPNLRHASISGEALGPAAELLYEAIRLLEPVDRSLISLHLDDYKNPEIADLLGITSAGAVATRISRIRAQLKQTLNPTS